ncbi:MAG: hypothetical protein JXA78_14635 [Anaerolineales bacterium]|nr:hypothetical protein [Anaerolineales bacterium]
MDHSPDTSNESKATGNAGEKQIVDEWKTSLKAMVCNRCDWSFLLPGDSHSKRCPHCFQDSLTPLGDQAQGLPYTHPPELLLPFTLSAGRLSQAVQDFTRGIPFAPQDLNPKNLQGRLSRLYLPLWLVDAQVQAAWQAEAGFDYEVVSHQDRYNENRGGWVSHQVKEGRIRWEPRLGRLSRSYHNVPAPALEEHNRLQKALGGYDLTEAQAYQPEALQKAFVRLPDRSPEGAWPEARPAFQAAAEEECRRAASADHIRQFSWKPEYTNQNWSLFLLPLCSTFYLNDEGQPQAVLIHGQTGKISGPRRASMKQATRTAWIVLGVAILIFVLSLLLSAAALVMPALLAVGALGLLAALLVGTGAILPIATVWWFNRRQGDSA